MAARIFYTTGGRRLTTKEYNNRALNLLFPIMIEPFYLSPAVLHKIGVTTEDIMGVPLSLLNSFWDSYQILIKRDLTRATTAQLTIENARLKYIRNLQRLGKKIPPKWFIPVMVSHNNTPHSIWLGGSKWHPASYDPNIGIPENVDWNAVKPIIGREGIYTWEEGPPDFKKYPFARDWKYHQRVKKG